MERKEPASADEAGGVTDGAPALKETGDPGAASQGDASTRASLDRSLTHGVAWMGGVKWATQILAWACTLVVARILEPADYGLVGLATAYLGIVTLLSEFGIGTTVVALRDLDDDALAQMNTVSLLFGVASFAVSCAMAPLLAWFFKQPQLTAVVVAMSGIFVITGLRVVPQAVLQRDMRFRDLALNEGMQSLVLSTGSVAFALLGFRYWTLVLSAVLGAAITTVLALRLVRLPLTWPRWRELGFALRFSRHTIVGRLAWYLYQNADFFVAGRALGKDALGAYTFGWNLASTPLERITSLVSRVTPSILSAVQRDAAALRRYLLTVTEAIALIAFPLTLGLGLVAPDIVPLALGPKWHSMIAPLQLLSIAAAIRAITPILPQVLTVTGHNRTTMLVNLWGAIVMPVAFAIGSRWGTIGIAAAWLVAYPVAVVVPMAAATLRQVQLPAVAYLRALLPAATAAACMTAAVLGARQLHGAAAPRLVDLLVDVAVGGLAYAGALLLFHRPRIMAFAMALRRART
jgi:polysaccharide transporter, PST family